jgi:hypothetical protein
MKTFIVALTLASVSSAAATPNHAHYHYMVGARANVGMSFAKQLYHEATQPGDLHLAIARQNATDLERLAGEIREWVVATEKVNSPEETALTKAHLDQMRNEAERLAKESSELGAAIDEALGSHADSSAGGTFRSAIAERAGDLFRGFRLILSVHKKAEAALDIPTPGDPPID